MSTQVAPHKCKKIGPSSRRRTKSFEEFVREASQLRSKQLAKVIKHDSLLCMMFLEHPPTDPKDKRRQEHFARRLRAYVQVMSERDAEHPVFDLWYTPRPTSLGRAD